MLSLHRFYGCYMRKFALFIITFFALTLSAQDKYCTSYGDYLTGNWQEVTGTVTLRSEKDNRLAYTLHSDDKRLRKLLRKNAFCLRHQGELYVNLRNSKCFDEVFVNAYELSGGKLLFARPDVTRTPGGIYVGYGDRSVPFSTRGFKSKSKLENLVCYLIEDMGGDGRNINFFKVTEEVMRQLLLGQEELWNEYQQLDSKRRDDADVVIDFLTRGGKI